MMLLSLVACISTTTTYESLNVLVNVPTAPAGVIFFAVDGDLPLRPFDEVYTTEAGEVDVSVRFPVAYGERLGVYVWEDTDEDGVFCAPGAEEYAGITVVERDWEVQVTVVPDTACAGPERLYP